MLILRKAVLKDKKMLIKLLTEEFDFYYEGMSLDNFWLAEEDGKIVGIVQLEDHADYSFLNALGVIGRHKKQGIGSFILHTLLESAKKPVYIQTLIPEFLQKFGFQTVPPPSFMPPRNPIRCEDCFPDKCVCMVKFPHVS
jgi:N-acetylglutamate synthase-like GNAT family acetyltransferase